MLRPLVTAAILAFAVTAAQADPVQESMSVAYGDLNLSSSQDATVLADRLEVAAKTVCLNSIETKAPIRKILVHRCIELAVNRATGQIRDEITSNPSKAVLANLVSVRQMVASAD